MLYESTCLGHHKLDLIQVVEVLWSEIYKKKMYLGK